MNLISPKMCHSQIEIVFLCTTPMSCEGKVEDGR